MAAMEIVAAMKRKEQKRLDQGAPCWQIRIGMHTGRLVAGVIGQEKFAYDVWGDTVNTASRMESSGRSGRVNVSGAVYEQIEALFDCEYRGKQPVKNKGELDIYFVDRLRPELASGAEGMRPNERFFELYQGRRATEFFCPS